MTDRRVWPFVAAVYCAVFGSILWVSHGIPYAIDNNESFSSLWHGRNLLRTSFWRTKGLADEVAAWHAAASPYIHSHQGDFPRIFSFLLYLIGARSIESQIFITTFTVGLAAIWMAYRFLRTIGPPPFAALACLAMITDYALFGQWQVNTYRVWYGFFFFSSLLWVSSSPRLGLGLLNFFCLFYGEYVYAIFVALTTAAYGLLLYRKEGKLLLQKWGVIAGGGGLAAALLTLQLTAYMGWSNLVQDVRYTLTARNMAPDSEFAANVAKFYADHHVIFLQNFLDAAPLRSVSAFLSSLYQSHLQYYTPCLCFAALLVLLGALVASIPKRDARQALGVVLLAAAWWGLAWRDQYFHPSLQEQWNALFPSSSLEIAEACVFFGAAVFAMLTAMAGFTPSFGPPHRLGRLLGLSGCVLCAYGVVYRIFTGYIYSGYLNRQAPFLVFWTDVLLGAACYFLWSAAHSRNWMRRLAVSALLVGSLGAWGALQIRYFEIVPPDNYDFLRLLKKAPYHGHSFVTNTYAAPIANETGSWAYAEKTVFTGRLRLGPEGFGVERDLKYLWFADQAVNPAYAKPDFGLLISQPSSIAEAFVRTMERRDGRPSPAIAFADSGVVGRATSPFQPFLQDRFMTSDGVHYSIVRFDWDYPPFLRVVDDPAHSGSRPLDLVQKIRLSEEAQALHRRWRITLAPICPESAAAAAPFAVAIADATIDDRQVFAPASFTAAGWKPLKDSSNTGPATWLVDPVKGGTVSAYVTGDYLHLRFLAAPRGGRLRVEVNDVSQILDLRSAARSPLDFALSVVEPYGAYTALPNFPPGAYVRTLAPSGGRRPYAVVTYRYVDQDDKAEENTVVRTYWNDGDWHLLDAITFLGRSGIPVRLEPFRRANPDTLVEYARTRSRGDQRSYEQWLADFLATHRTELTRPGIVREAMAGPSSGDAPDLVQRVVPLPSDLNGIFQLSVTPGTRTKSGPEYFGAAFPLGRVPHLAARMASAQAVAKAQDFQAVAKAQDLLYGWLILKLHFDVAQVGRYEPLVTTGAREAGDILYVAYTDPGHIRLGFDHWFEGGPITPPIPIDYSKEHVLDISLGSLFPSEGDVMFSGVPLELVDRIKHRIVVKLDDITVLDAPATFYDSTPAEVTVGKNTIHGTSCSESFTGQIDESLRIWRTAR